MVGMIKLFKSLLAIATISISIGCGNSQPSANVDYETILDRSTIAATINIRNNFGQSFHNVIVVLGDAPSKTCNDSSQLGVALEGAFEPTFTNFFNILVIGGDLTTVTKQYSRFGVGAYPFLRVALMSFDTTNCTATVDYIGSLNPVSPPNQSSNFTAGGFVTTPFSVQAGTGAGAIELVYPGAGTFNSAIPNVYGFTIINSSPGFETISIGAAPPGFCGPIIVNWLTAVVLPPGTNQNSVIISNSPIPLFTASVANRNICLVYGSNAAAHKFTGYIVYRLE
jgi:hypothetical protein